MIRYKTMTDLYVPYKHKKPATVSINGHNLLILSQEKGVLQDDMDLLGADRIRSIRTKGGKLGIEKMIGKIAQEVDGGVVIAPSDVDLRDVIKNLESELPWVH